MVNELSHPLVTEMINRLRKVDISANTFRQTLKELTRILCYEAFNQMHLQNKPIKTWLGLHQFEFLNQQDIVAVPIMRAGLPMLEALEIILPDSPSGFLAMKRDEVTHIAKTYYNRIPDCTGKTVMILDPMVATGGSLNDAIDLIKQQNPKRILTLNIIGSPEGIKAVTDKHPDVQINIAKIDERLDSNKFIYPGLGDAGDRAFNTVE